MLMARLSARRDRQTDPAGPWPVQSKPEEPPFPATGLYLRLTGMDGEPALPRQAKRLPTPGRRPDDHRFGGSNVDIVFAAAGKLAPNQRSTGARRNRIPAARHKLAAFPAGDRRQNCLRRTGTYDQTGIGRCRRYDKAHCQDGDATQGISEEIEQRYRHQKPPSARTTAQSAQENQDDLDLHAMY